MIGASQGVIGHEWIISLAALESITDRLPGSDGRPPNAAALPPSSSSTEAEENRCNPEGSKQTIKHGPSPSICPTHPHSCPPPPSSSDTLSSANMRLASSVCHHSNKKGLRRGPCSLVSTCRTSGRWRPHLSSPVLDQSSSALSRPSASSCSCRPWRDLLTLMLTSAPRLPSGPAVLVLLDQQTSGTPS